MEKSFVCGLLDTFFTSIFLLQIHMCIDLQLGAAKHSLSFLVLTTEHHTVLHLLYLILPITSSTPAVDKMSHLFLSLIFLCKKHDIHPFLTRS